MRLQFEISYKNVSYNSRYLASLNKKIIYTQPIARGSAKVLQERLNFFTRQWKQMVVIGFNSGAD